MVAGVSGGVGVIGNAGRGGVGAAGVGVDAHPARIMLANVTTVNKGIINFFIFPSFLNPPLFSGLSNECLNYKITSYNYSYTANAFCYFYYF
jgi:hypothetical protein